jgi:2-keto-4-pentenoate hydratase/2-oxohepta-3-ene-1,7-dioic acid hydratase in catechol pathway
VKLVAYRRTGRAALGVVDPQTGQVFGVQGHDGLDAADALGHLIAAWPTRGAGSVRLAESGTDLAEVTLLAPLPRLARNIFCVGKNYREHAVEFARSGFDVSGADSTPPHPIVFTKPPSSVIGPGEPITLPVGLTNAVDYEAELAVIIGAEGRRIPESAAWEYVWGYTILNDVTARDLQQQHKQWFLGKSPDTFCPMGPWAVTADEVDPTDLTVECWVNGELRQRANTKDTGRTFP